MGLLDVLQQYSNPATAPTGNVHEHFDQVAQQASPQQLGNGVAAAFRSDATPPFGRSSATCSASRARSSAPASSTS